MTISIQKNIGRLAVLVAFSVGALSAQTCSVGSNYSTGDGTDGNLATPLGNTPPYHLVATQAGGFSYVLLYPGQTFTLSQLASLSATFLSNAGGAGGGAPRLRILLDADNSGNPPGDGDANDKSISVYLGPSPSFTSTDAVLNTYSNFNVIGNNDAGRYDTSALAGGSPFTTYAAAIAAYGNLKVLRLGFVLDTFAPFPNRDETLFAINAAFGGPGSGCFADPYQVSYASNLLNGDSYVNITNTGAQNGFDPAGRICVNVYTFDPSEELVSCCSCLVTPDGLKSLSVKQDLVSNTLTPGVPGSVVIKFLSSTPVAGTCNAAGPTQATLAPGLRAWTTSLHQNSVSGNFEITENVAQTSMLSTSELTKLTTYCGFIQANGSGFGICKSCRVGGLGGAQQ